MPAAFHACAHPLRRRTPKAVRPRTLWALALLLVAAGLLVAPRIVYTMGRGEAVPTVTYTVEAGDTLWAIAQQFRSGEDARKVIYEIKQANHLRSSDIRPGQVLVIPLPGKR